MVLVFGDGNGGWEGYSINNRFVFMSDDSSHVGIYDDSENHWILSWEDNDYLKLIDPDGDGDSFVIDSGGNVGIGTTSADAKLEVIGDAIIGAEGTGLSINSDGHIRDEDDYVQIIDQLLIMLELYLILEVQFMLMMIYL